MILISCMVYNNVTPPIASVTTYIIRPRDIIILLTLLRVCVMHPFYDSVQSENYFIKLYIQKQRIIKQLCRVRLLLMALS